MSKYYILDYLYTHGDIECTLAEVEFLYERFSREEFGVSWKEVTPKCKTLTIFSNWLDELEDEDD